MATPGWAARRSSASCSSKMTWTRTVKLGVLAPGGDGHVLGTPPPRIAMGPAERPQEHRTCGYGTAQEVV